jgi:hypothetical protein
MDVTHIKAVEWDLIRIITSGLWVANLTILFGLGELGDDWDS